MSDCAPSQPSELARSVAGCSSSPSLCSAIPRRPWLLSKQYSMTFVLSQDNEIIMGDTACKYLGDDVLRHIIAAVNAYSPNRCGSATSEGRRS